MTDDEIYRSVGQILYDISPSAAQQVIVDAQITPENDHCKLLFDYIGQDGKKQWFLPPSARVDSDLFDLLVKLKAFFASKNLYPEGKPWTGCIIMFSVEKTSIKFDFKYG